MKHLALAAAGAAVVGITACSHSTAVHAAGAGHATGTPIAPVNCTQQYRIWDHDEGKGLMAAINAVTSAATAKHAQVLTAALKQAKPAVTRGTRHPIPACADPRGYWSVLLMHVNAAIADKASASTVHAAMQDVPRIHHQLVTELRQTAQ